MIRLTVDSLPELNLTVEEMRIIEAVSPVVSLERTAEGALLIVKDVNGTHQALIYDGQKGDPGIKGDPGNDGYSPVVSVQSIEGGHRITIEDSTGQHSFDVMNGDTGTGIVSIQKTGTAGLVDTYTITLSNGQTETFTVTNGQDGQTPTVPVQDVQVDGTSVLDNNVAKIPLANNATAGVVRVSTGFKLINGVLYIETADRYQVQSGSALYRPITPSNQHSSVFYGLAKLAGVDLASGSDTVGVYPDAAKTAILSMIGAETIQTVSGTTPTITGVKNTRYICGECSTLSITPPTSGDVEVIFESGSTATVLTVPNTVKFPAWFDPTSLEANVTYDIIITNGTLGMVMAWA